MINQLPYKLEDKYTETGYVVRYGPKKLIDRESKTIFDVDSADAFYREKVAAGMHVDVWKVTKEVTIKRIT